ncbi:FAD binding domain protein [Fonsecaea pedrosoi]|nr:FAD binding domain protein [Fonsecaea pedrosoi]
MRFSLHVAAIGLGITASVAAQDSPFEPPEFNVTQALIDQGVNVSALPELASLTKRSSISPCSIACDSLRLLFGSSNVIEQGNQAFDAFTNAYWSVQQESVDPSCIFKPTSATQVSIAILLSRLTQCPFAAKSGGHAAFAGASSIQGGITMSLEKINAIKLSSDKRPPTLAQPADVTVIGGRVSAIGVGGLTTGGGISFFSNIHGWACDNVVSYEVVTASGVIVTASATQNKDLFFALRGGGNNFGIVTKFTLNAVPLPGGLMWGGGRVSTEDQFDALIDAFYNVGVNSPQDPNAAQILSFAYVQSSDLKVAAADLQYAQPIADAPIFSEYLSIPAISDTTSIRTLANLTQEFNASNPDGLRETYWAAAYKLNKNHTASVRDIFFEELESIKDAAGLVPAATLQVITEGQLAGMTKNGGNPLGLSASDGPFLLLNTNMMWTDAADDTRILQTNQRVIDRTVALAQSMGLFEDYIYMNYASQFQDVVSSYGAANKAKLQSIAAKYDPTGVFQTLQPGYFKLNGPPSPSGP